jgi:polar amino acid transport system substrate-binding protein
MRRKFLYIVFTALMVLLVAGCAAETEEPTPEKVVETKIVEVTKQVEITSEPEVVVVTPTAEPVELGPTPEATGLPEYEAPEGGLLEEIKERGVLRVGIECAVPPAEFFDPETGQCIGYDIDLHKRFAARLGVEYEYIDTAWSGVIPSLYTGEFDMIWSMMTMTDERRKAVNFSDSYGCDQVQWIVRKGDDRIQSIEDLDGLVVATQLNSAAEAQAIELENEEDIEYAELKSYDHFDGAYTAVRTGEADIATSTAWNNITLFEAQPGVFDVALYFPIYNNVGVATRKQDTDLLNAVDAFLDEIEKSGELADLQYKWYGYAFSCGETGPNPPDDWTPPVNPEE